MGAARRNLELKARDRHPERSRATCLSLRAEYVGPLVQEDVYFNVPRGRLKLRRQNDAIAQLIAYERPDLPRRRESRYRIIEVTDDTELERALAGTIGIAAVVKKTRHLFLLGSVRIHLDDVEGLGSFIEFEGVAQEDEDPLRFDVVLADLCRSFGIEEADLLPGSYCDLALAREGT